MDVSWRRPDRTPDRTWRWVAVDVALAVSLVGVTVATYVDPSYPDARPAGWGWVLVLAPFALVVLRRWAPLIALYGASAFYVAAAFDHPEGNSMLAAPVLAYTVGRVFPPRVSATHVAVAGAPVAVTSLYGPDGTVPVGVLVLGALMGVGWLVGLRMREREDREAGLAAEAELARREAEEAARQAVLEERTHIARELHDAVGHAVNVMVMQAGAARLTMTDPTQAQTMREIERVGRSALLDLDRMLGLLNADESDAEAPLGPAHGLGDIQDLVDGMASAGLEVSLCRLPAEEAGTVEQQVGAAAYRIVQEALTNVVKHAGPSRVEVCVDREPDDLRVRVADDGRGAAARPTGRIGRGLTGMGERVKLLGGRLQAGPRDGGGYVVEAVLPTNRGGNR